MADLQMQRSNFGSFDSRQEPIQSHDCQPHQSVMKALDSPNKKEKYGEKKKESGELRWGSNSPFGDLLTSEVTRGIRKPPTTSPWEKVANEGAPPEFPS
ncbi:hypothetical protein CRG98_016066 [Punica granatum]|uniref:Uncharacterized protein n=1 Tax=Punica granatum TaxID=22663 RepID=A0A2I0K4T3_PUNGR|nr:hypothetical protein CRG98_016066 [Punica granatum]